MSAPTPSVNTSRSFRSLNRSRLSASQFAVLLLALRNHDERQAERVHASPSSPPGRPDVFFWEALHVVYQLPYDPRRCGFNYITGEPRDEPLHGGQAFDRAVIGHVRYNRARAALSRTARRLEARGLVVRHAYRAGEKPLGLVLTDAGLALAQELSGRSGEETT